MSVFHDIGREAAALINVNQKSAMTKTALSPKWVANVLGKASPGAARRVQAIVHRMGTTPALLRSAKTLQQAAGQTGGSILGSAAVDAVNQTSDLARKYLPKTYNPRQILGEASQVKNQANAARLAQRPHLSGGGTYSLAPLPGGSTSAAGSAGGGIGIGPASGARPRVSMSGHGGGSSPAASVGASSAAPTPSPAASVGAASATPPTATPIAPRPIPLGNAPPHAIPAPGAGLGQTIGKGVDRMFSVGGDVLGKALKLPFSSGMPLERRLLTAGGLGVAGAGVNDALAYAADKTGLPVPHIGDWDPSRVKGLAKQEPWTTGLMHPLQYLASKNAPDAAPFRPAGRRGQMPSGLQFNNPTFNPSTGQWSATAGGTIDMEASPEVQHAFRQHQEATDAFNRFGIPIPGQNKPAPAAPPRATNPNMDSYKWSPPSIYATPPRTLASHIHNAAY